MDKASSLSLKPFNTILVLFIFMRLAVLLFFTPTGPLNVYTDLSFYFHTLQYSDQGYYPFVNMWYEYPPLSTYLVQGTYALVTTFVHIPDVFSIEYQIWTRLLGFVLLLFDVGVLYLLYKIVRSAWDQARAEWVVLVYAMAALPLFYYAYGHHIVMVFFTLLTIERFLAQRYTQSAVALGLAVASKLTPLFMLAPAVRFLWERRQKAVPAIIKYTAIAIGTTGLFYVPFLLMGSGQWVAASYEALAVKGSWATIWALIDGNWTANFGRLPEMIVLELATLPRTNSPVIPELLKSGLFVIAFGWFYLKRLEDTSPRRFVRYAVLSALVFHLWSKGWSPQWITLIVPLLLAAFPGRRGLNLILALTGITFLEWPIADAIASHGLLAFTILARTGIFVLVIYWLGKLIIHDPAKRVQPA